MVYECQKRTDNKKHFDKPKKIKMQYKGTILKGKSAGPLHSIGILCRELCNNSWTDQDAIWDVYSDGLM